MTPARPLRHPLGVVRRGHSLDPCPVAWFNLHRDTSPRENSNEVAKVGRRYARGGTNGSREQTRPGHASWKSGAYPARPRVGRAGWVAVVVAIREPPGDGIRLLTPAWCPDVCEVEARWNVGAATTVRIARQIAAVTMNLTLRLLRPPAVVSTRRGTS